MTAMAVRDTELAQVPSQLLEHIRQLYPQIITRLYYLLGEFDQVLYLIYYNPVSNLSLNVVPVSTILHHGMNGSDNLLLPLVPNEDQRKANSYLDYVRYWEEWKSTVDFIFCMVTPAVI